MKSISRQLSAFTAIFILIVAMAQPAVDAAIFASDAIYLFSGGKQIADNSVLVIYTKHNDEHLDVCHKGSLWLRQGPTWKPGPYTFVQTAHNDILNMEKWLATTGGKASRYTNKDYQYYLKKKMANSLRKVSVAIPTVKESPALVQMHNPPPRPGMAEGKIGYDRFFRMDLDTGAITQVPRSEIFKDSGK